MKRLQIKKTGRKSKSEKQKWMKKILYIKKHEMKKRIKITGKKEKHVTEKCNVKAKVTG